MAARKIAKKVKPLAPNDVGVLLEDLRSQQQSMLEAIESWGERLTRTMDERFSQVNARLDMLESVVRKNSEDIRKNSEDIRKNSSDIDALRTEVRRLRSDFDTREERAKLTQLEDRVAKLEKRLAG
jgi:chromosome segregation ATPase